MRRSTNVGSVPARRLRDLPSGVPSRAPVVAYRRGRAPPRAARHRCCGVVPAVRFRARLAGARIALAVTLSGTRRARRLAYVSALACRFMYRSTPRRNVCSSPRQRVGCGRLLNLSSRSLRGDFRILPVALCVRLGCRCSARRPPRHASRSHVEGRLWSVGPAVRLCTRPPLYSVAELGRGVRALTRCSGALGAPSRDRCAGSVPAAGLMRLYAGASGCFTAVFLLATGTAIAPCRFGRCGRVAVRRESLAGVRAAAPPARRA